MVEIFLYWVQKGGGGWGIMGVLFFGESLRKIIKIKKVIN